MGKRIQASSELGPVPDGPCDRCGDARSLPMAGPVGARRWVVVGLPVLEVTLRTRRLGVMRNGRSRCRGGGRSVLSLRCRTRCRALGLSFAVCPVRATRCCPPARKRPSPCCRCRHAPRAMRPLERGYYDAEFFREIAGRGCRDLARPASPCESDFVRRRIGRQLRTDYLALAHVVCVGGSWVAPAELIAAGTGRDRGLARTAANCPRSAERKGRTAFGIAVRLRFSRAGVDAAPRRRAASISCNLHPCRCHRMIGVPCGGSGPYLLQHPCGCVPSGQAEGPIRKIASAFFVVMRLGSRKSTPGVI